MKQQHICRDLVVLLLLLLLSSCALHQEKPQWQDSILYAAEEKNSLVHRLAPVFVAEEADQEYNRIGMPVAFMDNDQVEVKVDPAVAAIYTSVREFSTAHGEYTSIFYRIHFSRVPLRHLGAGKNVGLFVVVTIDKDKKPLLYSLLHTCGCYLAFIPTSYLPEKSWAKGWKRGRQSVFGENLPGYLDFSDGQSENPVILIRPGSHRVKDVLLMADSELQTIPRVSLQFYPFEALEQLPLPDGSTTSFYETSGSRKDYVKGSFKIWERLFIGWWSLDLRVGEDKRLGSNLGDGNVFYTSLKPWAREESDLRDFPGFLRYWGWNL